MKSQDILILLKLVSLRQQADPRYGAIDNAPYSLRALADSLGVSNSVNRSLDSGHAIRDRVSVAPKANQKALLEFILHGLKYVFPVKPGPLACGVATNFSAPVFKGKPLSASESKYVWPDTKGDVRGQSIEPLFKSVPMAVRQDERLYEYLALVDAIRLGHAREAGIANEELEMRLAHN